MVVGLLAEHVLFLQGITLAERLYHIGEHILKEHVLLRIGTKLLHGIDYLENNRRLPWLKKDDIAVRFLRSAHKGRQIFFSWYVP